MRGYATRVVFALLAIVPFLSPSKLFAAGVVATGMDVGEQYVTLYKDGFIILADSGTTDVIVSNVFSNDSDRSWFQFLPPLPDTIAAGESDTLPFKFLPDCAAKGGARHYKATWVIVNSTGDTAYATTEGTGVIVHVTTSIDTTYVCYLDSTVVVSLNIDSWDDPLGKASFDGYVMEMYHYRRSVVELEKGFNSGTNRMGANAEGQQGTLSEGATIVDNIQDDTIPVHTSGEQSYYELLVYNITKPVRSAGTLIKFLFRGIRMDTSWEVYDIPTVWDSNGDVVGGIAPSDGYVDVTCSPGLITVIAPPPFFSVALPNPFPSSSSVRFSLHEPAHITFTVFNVLGRRIGAPVDADFPAGIFTENIRGDNLPNGMYFYILTKNNTEFERGELELMK